MESGKVRWKRMDIKDQIQGMVTMAAASGQRYGKDRNGLRFRSQSGGAGFNRYRSK